MDDLELQQMDEDGYDRISFGDDEIEYPHAQGYQNFVEQLSSIFLKKEKISKTIVRRFNMCAASFQDIMS
jgi:all-trans-retinol 13,14-reductase